MGISEIQKYVAWGDGHMDTARSHLATVESTYIDGSVAAQVLSSALMDAQTALCRLEKCFKDVATNLSLGDMAMDSALKAYGPEGANLENSTDRESAGNTLYLASRYQAQIKEAFQKNQEWAQEFGPELPETLSVITDLQSRPNMLYSILGITLASDMPAMQTTAARQGRASSNLKEQLGR